MPRQPTPPDLLATVRAQTPDDAALAAMFGPVQDEGRQDIPLDLIDDNPWQPRQDYDGIDELAADIQRNGLLQIPAGRRMADGRVQLQYGHRRLRAVRSLGWPTMPVDIQPIVSDNDMAVRAWVENHNRQDFTPLDQARYFKRLQDDGWTQQQIATAVGVSRPTIANAVRLLQLPETIQKQVAEAGLSARQAEALVSLTQLPAALTDKANRHWDKDATPAGIIEAALSGASSDEIRRRTKQLIEQHAKAVHDNPWYRHEFPAHLAGMVKARCDECETAIRRDTGVYCPERECYLRKAKEWQTMKLMGASIESGIPIADKPIWDNQHHEDFTYTGEAGRAVLAQEPRCKNMRLVVAPPNQRQPNLTTVEGHPEAVIVCQKAGNNQCACLNKARKTIDDVSQPNRTSGCALRELQKPCIDLLAEQFRSLPPGLLALASQRFHFDYSDHRIVSTDGADLAAKLATRALNTLSPYTGVEANRSKAEQIMDLAGLRAPWLPPLEEEIAQQLDQVEIFADTFVDAGDGLPTAQGMDATFRLLDAAQRNLAALDANLSAYHALSNRHADLVMRIAALADRVQTDRDRIPTEL